MSARGIALRTAVFAAVVTLATGLRTPVAACGHCIEDKIAATYDYGVLTAASRHGHVVVFSEIRGPAAGAGHALEVFVAHVLATVPGVDRGSVRVSLDPPAAAFACDPAGPAPQTLLDAMTSRLATKKLRLVLIKIDPGPRIPRRPTRPVIATR